MEKTKEDKIEERISTSDLMSCISDSLIGGMSGTGMYLISGLPSRSDLPLGNLFALGGAIVGFYFGMQRAYGRAERRYKAEKRQRTKVVSHSND